MKSEHWLDSDNKPAGGITQAPTVGPESITEEALRACPELSSPGCPLETPGTACVADCPQHCRASEELERWRSRCDVGLLSTLEGGR